MSYFLQLDGIEGTSTVRGREDWLEVDEIGWGVSQTSAPGGGGRTGRATLQPITLAARLPTSTPLLFLACAQARTIKDATFEAVTDGDSASITLRIELEDVQVTALDLAGADGEARPSVRMSLSYRQLSITTFHVDEFGGQQEASSASWDAIRR